MLSEIVPLALHITALMKSRLLSQISFHLLTAEPVAEDVPAVDGAPETMTNPL